MRLFILFICCVSTSFANPWGKDADLAYPCKPSSTHRKTSILASLGESLIAFHQEIISPADGPRSHFYPSSSQYTLDAMRKYGFFKGVMIGCDRLMRENNDPWIYPTVDLDKYTTLKYDPVR